jgi:thioester reductase-like protein
MPMTASGKLDRKKLPAPSFTEDIEEYVAPETELQKTLCDIAAKILEREKYGIQQDFFINGGDSLSAIEYVVQAEQKGLDIKLQMIFDYPTIEELAEVLEKGERWKDNYTPERFEKYQEFFRNNYRRNHYDIQRKPIKTVLLSGITGFLGAHILDELLSAEDCKIYCLVRSISVNDRRGRFPQMLEHYFGEKYKDEIGKRIIPIVGDITDDKLSPELPEKVDMVIHSAATVKHYGFYEYFHKVNTLGTKHMAKYALDTGAKFIYISTISVSGNSFSDSFETEYATEERFFDETTLYQGQSMENVYVRSKFEAECAVLDYVMEGLQANIIRVGNLTNRSTDFKFQPNYEENAFLSRVKAALEFGCIPDYLLPLYCEFSPINDVANAVVKIAQNFNMDYTVFHVNSNRNLYFDRMITLLQKLNIPMQVVSGEEFMSRLKAAMSSEQSYVYEAFMNDLDDDGKLAYDSNIHIQNDFTLSYLKQLGFEWSEIDYEYVKGYFS